MTRHQVEQYRINDKTGIKLWHLDFFARECGTKIEPVFPIFIVLCDGDLVAYYYAQPQVTVRPTVHPDKLSARAFYETAKTVIAATKNVFGNPVWLIDPNSKLATETTLGKLGLTRQPLSVWET